MKIVVTGGASGVGDALVERLREHEVWIIDRNEPETVRGRHRFVPLDLTDSQAIEGITTALPDAVDGLANVAGIAAAPDPETVLAVNFLGLRLLTETLIPRLAAGGRIISVSSVAGREWLGKYERLLPLLETPSFAEGLAWCQANRDTLARDP